MKHAIIFLAGIFFIPSLAGCELLLPDLKKVDDVSTEDTQGDDWGLDQHDPVAEEGGRCNINEDCEDGNPCNGTPFCNQISHECEQVDPPPDGRVCNEVPRRICIENECRESRCGDGFVDIDAGESCEPPGTGPCNAECKKSCIDDRGCDDGQPCTLDHCNTDSGFCDNRFQPSDMVCGPSEGPCDIEERCTGTEPACPQNRFEPSSLVCRPAVNVCDLDEHCPGDGPDCPTVDRVKPAETSCRAPVKECELEAVCNGTDPECPPNPVVTDGRVCRDSTSSEYCDPAEVCDGSSLACPVDVLFDHIHDIERICSGENHVMAKTGAGPFVGWGGNWHGELGRGTTGTTESTPAEATLLSSITSPIENISCGAAFTCVLLEGGLKCFGKNDSGQLGIGSMIVTVPNPTNVIGLEPGSSAGVTDFSAGYEHACAVVNGGVMCWGNNGYGQLGDNTYVTRPEAAPVTGLAGNAVEVSVGNNFTCARLEDNSVQCWGNNGYGQLGNGETVNSPVPVDVADLTEDAAEIETGNFFTCVRSVNFHVSCWGYNYEGQVGIGYESAPVLSPTLVANLAENVDDISIFADGNFTCAHLRGVNQVKCWGVNDRGQLGNGTNVNSNTAVSVMDPSGANPLAPVVMVAAGATHACALMTDGTVKCWGNSDFGQAGDGLTPEPPDRQYILPVDVICGF